MVVNYASLEEINIESLRAHIDACPHHTLEKIAICFNARPSIISNILKKNDIQHKPTPIRTFEPIVDIEMLRDFIAINPGHTLQQIGAHFNVSHSTIAQYIKRFNLQRTKAPRNCGSRKSRIDLEELRKLIEQLPNHSLKQLGEYFNVSAVAIYNVIKKNNIKRTNLNNIRRIPSMDILREYIESNPHKTLKQIGEHFNVSDAAVCYARKRHAI